MPPPSLHPLSFPCNSLFFFFFFFFFPLFLLVSSSATLQNSKTFIVVLSDKTFPKDVGFDDPARLNENHDLELRLVAKHEEILSSIATKSSQRSPKKLFSYSSAINAFSAVLTKAQADLISKHKDVAKVYPDRKLKKTTFSSYSFLGLDQTEKGAWSYTNGTDVIIGIIDDGIWPENPSFDSGNLGPVPTKFKGICQTGQNFTKRHCNRKIVGARYFNQGFLADLELKKFPADFKDYVSPRSAHGHGVHTASIAGGSPVTGASIGDINFGTTNGVARSSRIAVYKVCWTDSSGISDSDESCMLSDIVAAMDSAVKDGVDLISTSLGSTGPSSYSDDVVAQAALGALLSGVLCVFGAGNDGPNFGSVINTAPWSMSVASSTLDRTFVNSITFGNSSVYYGFTLSNWTGLTKGRLPLVMDYDPNNTEAELCLTLDPIKVNQKVVFCEALEYGNVDVQALNVYQAGGLGMIVPHFLYDDGQENPSIFDFFSVPTTQVNASIGIKMLNYVKHTKNPVVRITPFRIAKGRKYIEAPIMSYDSALGPNPVSESFLKPDITAPGVHILGAWTEDKSSPVLSFGTRAKFQFSSGTSMACPHVSGAIALLKAYHPSWPVSWLFSAVLTTAYTKTNRNKPIRTNPGEIASPLNYGAGHLNVNRALFPSLVYGWTSSDLFLFRCLASPNPKKLNCSNAILPTDLNLPSVSLVSLCNSTVVKRRLTSVERKRTRFTVQVSPPEGTQVTVQPPILVFDGYNHTLEYEITVHPIKAYDELKLNYASYQYSYGSVVWVGKHGRSVKLTLAANVPSDC